MMKTFLFYDIETSGLNPAFDQVLTFACIRTDLSLNELAREVITVRLREDIVPSPGAFLTHGLTPEELSCGISEYHAAKRIHKLFNTPETISIGYNSLGFDDEFLRFLFYRNLLDPYSHQFANGCSRMDMLPVAAIYHLFCEQALSWPVLETGKASLKLEHLSLENRFQTSGKAHEAMSDVEALLSLTRIFSAYDDIWEYVQGFFDKQKDLDRINRLKSSETSLKSDLEIGLMVSVSFGADVNYIAPVVYVGRSVPYKNQSLWVRLDRDDLFESLDDEIGIYELFVIRKKAGDQLFILPTLDRFWERLTPKAAKACEKNLQVIRENSNLFFKTIEYHREYKYPDVPDIDLDADLYQGGFFKPVEKSEISLFHNAEDKSKFTILKKFKSARIRDLASRIMVRNFSEKPDKIPGFIPHLKGLAGDQLGNAVKGYKDDKKLTCAQAILELDEMVAKGAVEDFDPDQKALFDWLNKYVRRMSAFLTNSL